MVSTGGLVNGGTSATAPLEVGALRRMIRACPQALRARGEDGRLPLHDMLACSHGVTAEAVKAVVGPCPDALLAPDGHGLLPIHHAARSLTLPLDALRYLARRSHRPIRRRALDGSLPLYCAYNAPEQNVRFLAERWPKAIRETDGEGNRMLHRAAQFCTSVTELQLVYQLSPEAVSARNSKGRLPVHAAAMGGRAWAVDFLVEMRPGSVREADADGCLPVHLSLAFVVDVVLTPPTAVHYLAHRFPETLTVADNRGRLPLHHAAARLVGCDHAGREGPALIPLVMGPGPDALRHQDNEGNLPLHAALLSTAPMSVVRLLVEPHPDALRVRNAAGLLPLPAALSTKYAYAAVVAFLLGRHPESARATDPRGRSPLHLALAAPRILREDRHGRRSLNGIVRSLVRRWPAAVPIRDPNGLLPFQVAAAASAAGTGEPPDLVYYLARLRPDLVRGKEAYCNRGGVATPHMWTSSVLKRRKARVSWRVVWQSDLLIVSVPSLHFESTRLA